MILNVNVHLLATVDLCTWLAGVWLMWLGGFSFLPVLLDREEAEKNRGLEGMFCLVKTSEERLEWLDRGDGELDRLW